MLDQTVSDGLPRGVLKISGNWAENPGFGFYLKPLGIITSLSNIVIKFNIPKC